MFSSRMTRGEGAALQPRLCAHPRQQDCPRAAAGPDRRPERYAVADHVVDATQTAGRPVALVGGSAAAGGTDYAIGPCDS